MKVHSPLIHWLSAALHQQHGLRAAQVIGDAMSSRPHNSEQHDVMQHAATALRRARQGCGGFVDIEV